MLETAFATRRDLSRDSLMGWTMSDILEDIIEVAYEPLFAEDNLVFETKVQAQQYQKWLEVTYNIGGYAVAHWDKGHYYVVKRDDFEIRPKDEMTL